MGTIITANPCPCREPHLALCSPLTALRCYHPPPRSASSLIFTSVPKSRLSCPGLPVLFPARLRSSVFSLFPTPRSFTFLALWSLRGDIPSGAVFCSSEEEQS